MQLLHESSTFLPAINFSGPDSQSDDAEFARFSWPSSVCDRIKTSSKISDQLSISTRTDGQGTTRVPWAKAKTSAACMLSSSIKSACGMTLPSGRPTGCSLNFPQMHPCHCGSNPCSWTELTMVLAQEAFLGMMYPVAVLTLEHYQDEAGQREQRRKLDPAIAKALKRRAYLLRTGAAEAVAEPDPSTAFKVSRLPIRYQCLRLHKGFQLEALSQTLTQSPHSLHASADLGPTDAIRLQLSESQSFLPIVVHVNLQSAFSMHGYSCRSRLSSLCCATSGYHTSLRTADCLGSTGQHGWCCRHVLPTICLMFEAASNSWCCLDVSLLPQIVDTSASFTCKAATSADLSSSPWPCILVVKSSRCLQQ